MLRTVLRSLSRTLPAFLIVLALAACAVAPGTGRTIFTGGLSEESERDLGAQEHPKILRAFGGAYPDPELQRYVDSIGDLLVATSETPNADYTFTVLNTPTVNAFALPGGYVYVTRGLVTLANSEAELAGVIGHEIGHVTARHTAERYGNVVLGNVATIASAIFLGQAGAQATASGAALALQSYSRDQEFEADQLGVRYINRATYDPHGMGDFLGSLLQHSRLLAEQMGRPGAADQFDIMQTHPLTSERVARASQLANQANGADNRDRQFLLSKLDGVVYGDTADQGFVRDNRFLHPELGFKFEVPQGFFMMNNPNAVQALGPGGRQIIFDAAPEPYSGSLRSYLLNEWAPNVNFNYVDDTTINGFPATVAGARLDTRGGVFDVTAVAIGFDRQTIYRFLFASPPSSTDGFRSGIRRTYLSFNRLSQAEAASLRPYRIRIHTVRPGDTPAGLAATFPFSDWALETFYVLNGLRPGEGLRAGEQVKLVSY